jgi:uncharacterized cupin superfamily protein
VSKAGSYLAPISREETSISDLAGIAVPGSIVMLTPANVDLDPEPFPPGWVVSGSPQARCKKVARSYDRTSHIVVWDCTPGSFKWHYGMDEAIVVISGEAFMINDKGVERRFGPGDLGFFPAGTSCTWRITQPLRKVGILKESMWGPLGLAVKAWHKLLRMAGLAGESPL